MQTFLALILVVLVNSSGLTARRDVPIRTDTAGTSEPRKDGHYRSIGLTIVQGLRKILALAVRVIDWLFGPTLNQRSGYGERGNPVNPLIQFKRDESAPRVA